MHCHSVGIPKDSMENETSFHSRVLRIHYAAHDFPENSHLHEVGRVSYNCGNLHCFFTVGTEKNRPL